MFSKLYEFFPHFFGLGLWIIWWLLLVDWNETRTSLRQGGWIGLTLLGLTATLVWGVLDPVGQQVLGIPLPSFWAKITLVSGLGVTMLGCGALQLALWPPRSSHDSPRNDSQHAVSTH